MGQGGGIFNSGVLNLTDATVSGNRADDPDFISNQGGGIFNNERMNLRNVAVTGNVGERVRRAASDLRAAASSTTARRLRRLST